MNDMTVFMIEQDDENVSSDEPNVGQCDACGELVRDAGDLRPVLCPTCWEMSEKESVFG